MEIFRPRLGKILPDGGTLGAHVKLSISGPVGRQRALGGGRGRSDTGLPIAFLRFTCLKWKCNQAEITVLSQHWATQRRERPPSIWGGVGLGEISL